MRLSANRRGPRAAPDISSEVYFPSLSSANSAPSADERRDNAGGEFEEVRAGGGQKTSSQHRQAEAPRLALGNKFAALRD